jgi:enoyl-CoA hydratase
VPELIVERRGAVGTVKFSNPAKHNALTLDMWRGLPLALKALDEDRAINVVVLIGEGEKAFISGADISQFDSVRAEKDSQDEYNRLVDEAYKAPIACSKPVIAAIRGICYGGGLGIAAACDVRLAADNAKFRMPAARLGLGYTYDGLRRFADVIGTANTADIFFSARVFDAADAVRMGFVSRVIKSADFEGELATYCALIAENAPLTIAAAKRALIECAKNPAERDIASVDAMVRRCFESADYKEGRAAFAQRRPPKFTGS